MSDTQLITVRLVDRTDVGTRRHLDPVSLDDLAAAVACMHERITVRYVPSSGRFTMVAGEKLWRRAQAEGRELIEAVVLVAPADDAAWRLAKAVGWQVGDPAITPMEEAVLFQRLLVAGYAMAEIAEVCGKQVTYIRWRVELLDLIDQGQLALSEGRLPVSLAWYISRLAERDQLRFLLRWWAGHYTDQRDAERAAKALRPPTS